MIPHDYVPVLIGTYTRLDHLKRTIASLQDNSLAPSTSLFVCSDGAKEGDEGSVAAVRDYLKGVDGFHSVTVIARDRNIGRIANNRGGFRDLLQRYGRGIFLEDDNVVAPGFLAFMNAAMTLYQDSPRILAVGGYLPPIRLPDGYARQAIALPRYLGWGIGTWAKRFESFGAISPQDYANLLNSPVLMNKVNTLVGADLLRRYRAEATGHLNGIDTRATYRAMLDDCFFVYPRQSLVHNIGFDGSGIHCGLSNKFDVELWDTAIDFQLPRDIDYDPAVVASSLEFFQVDNQEVSPEVLDSIIREIDEQDITTFSIWGIDVMTDLFLRRIDPHRYRINFFLDSWADAQTRYGEHRVVTPQQALDAGENCIVILSFASRHAMAADLQKLAPDCRLIMYRADSAGA